MKKHFTKDSILERSSNMLSSTIDDEVVLLSIANSKYYGMDSIGKAIWNLLDKPIKLNDLVESVLKEYSGNKDEIEKDIRDYLQELYENNVIEIQ